LTPAIATVEETADGPVTVIRDAADQAGDDSGVPDLAPTPDELLSNLEHWLALATSAEGIEQVWDELDIESEFAHDPPRMGKAIDMKIRHNQRVEQKAGGDVLDDLFNKGGA
jgi:hypothetical protein